MGWEPVCEKFERLAEAHVEPPLTAELAEAIRSLEEHDTRDLTALLARAGARETMKGAAR